MKNVSKAYGIYQASYLWTNSCLLMIDISEIDMIHNNILIIIGLGLVFFIKLYLNIRNYYQKVRPAPARGTPLQPPG